MPGTNQFLPFAAGAGANTLTPAAYAALTALLSGGFQSGVAPSAQFNTALRQATTAVAGLAKFISDQGPDVLDNGSPSSFASALLTALQSLFAPNGRPGHTFTDNDWAPLGGGLIIQWGKGTYNNASTITLPTAYPTSHIATFAAIDGQFAGSSIELTAVSDMTLTNFKIYGVTNPQAGGVWTAVNAPQWWVSIGR